MFQQVISHILKNFHHGKKQIFSIIVNNNDVLLDLYTDMQQNTEPLFAKHVITSLSANVNTTAPGLLPDMALPSLINMPQRKTSVLGAAVSNSSSLFFSYLFTPLHTLTHPIFHLWLDQSVLLKTVCHKIGH